MPGLVALPISFFYAAGRTEIGMAGGGKWSRITRPWSPAEASGQKPLWEARPMGP